MHVRWLINVCAVTHSYVVQVLFGVLFCFECSIRPTKKALEDIVDLYVTHMTSSALWMSSYHMYEWVRALSHIYMSACFSHVTQFMPHIWIRECLSSSHKYQCVSASLLCGWVMSHGWTKKHQRICFRYVPVTELRSRDEMTTMWTCVDTQCVALGCIVLHSVCHCVSVCCSVLQCVQVFWSVLKCVAVCCRML